MFVQFLVFVFLTSDNQVLGCPSGWETHESMCYHFSHDTESWIGALEMCKQFHGQLVEIEDADENKYLEAQVNLRGQSHWIALSDAEEEATWKWMISEEPLTSERFADWASGQPDNYAKNENCACFYQPANFLWNDYPCHMQLQYICEKPDNQNQLVG